MFYYDGDEIPDGYEEVKQVNKKYTIKTEEVISKETEYTLPCSYIVGNNDLELFVEGILLSEGYQFEEIGGPGQESNKVKFSFDIAEGSIITIKGGI